MDAATIRAMLEQHFEHAGSDPDHAHAMYTEDAVLEFPQSGERFAGVENLREWRSNCPANTSFEFREVRGRDDFWVAELSISYDGGPANFGVSILELRGDKIARESIYVAEGFAPPEWRSMEGCALSALHESGAAGPGAIRTCGPTPGARGRTPVSCASLVPMDM